jgi:hypothetical protein
MTLRELRAAHPHLFHPNQDWFEDEAFMDVPCLAVKGPPTRVAREHDVMGRSLPPHPSTPSVPAATLARAYVEAPELLVWRDYLWTSDTDRQGQRVYVGGTANGKGFEIHRHLHLTARWGIPVWT